MAVAPTGAIYKALEFDGVSSRTYGVYITGEAVYNAPERDVEMITIPGRSGSFALDNGRFENITVTYPAGIFAETEADFRDAISEFRNFLCSRKGYVRLQDEYNPNEYRMAVYKSGLEVEPAMLKAGEFEITFDCKPQRWLTSGETAVTIASSGDTITNPTLFESGPLLEVEGYGDIEFNGFEITISAGDAQIIPIADSDQYLYTSSVSFSFDETAFNLGDTIQINGGAIYGQIGYNGSRVDINSVTDNNGSFNTIITGYGYATTTFGTITFAVGTYTEVADISTFLCLSSTKTLKRDIKITYTAGNITITISTRADSDAGMISGVTRIEQSGIFGDSSIQSPMFIDCDIGEAYKFVDDVPISLNAYIDLGSKLPTLAPGSNAITFDNTITDLKVTPRWWRV